jgi:hypothetical protein
MRSRTRVTALLLFFAGSSLAYLAVNRGAPSAPVTATHPPPCYAPPVAAAATGAPQVVVHYFHATARCQTCRAIEQVTGEALTAAFGDRLAAASVAWRPLNVEEPDHRHFIEEFQLTSRDVVVVRQTPAGERQWKRLGRVWQLAHDRGALIACTGYPL